MGWISETMCFQSGGCMLIAELGARCTAHPASQTSYCEKTGPLRTLDSTFKHLITAWSTRIHTDAQLGNITWRIQNFICVLMWVFYRSWVPDEDLGATIGELFTWDLEVGHQYLYSFSVGSQRNQKGHLKTSLTFQGSRWSLKNTQAQLYRSSDKNLETNWAQNEGENRLGQHGLQRV